MSPRKQWVFSPGSGGRRIPPAQKAGVRLRIERAAEKHFRGKYLRVDVRFKGRFCYIDLYREPANPPKGWPPRGGPETRAQHPRCLRETPLHLCRLRYFSEDRWGCALFSYSSEKYEMSVFPSGDFFGMPEEAFVTSARSYLLS